MNPGKISIGIAGAFGGIIAVIGDLIQKQDASAVLVFASTLNRTFQLGVATWVWALILVLLAVALCIVFEPDSKPRAFYIGASILALLMTAVPFKMPDAPPKSAASKVAVLPANFIQLVSDQQSQTSSAAVTATVHVQIRLPVQASAKAPFPIYLTFYDPTGDRKWREEDYALLPTRVSGLYTTELTYHFNPAPDLLYLRVEATSLQTIELQAKRMVDGPSVVYRFNAVAPFSTAPTWQKNLFGVQTF